MTRPEPEDIAAQPSHLNLQQVTIMSSRKAS
jgi:hypothetical protein